jgi:hypothetical protein
MRLVFLSSDYIIISRERVTRTCVGPLKVVIGLQRYKRNVKKTKLRENNDIFLRNDEVI